MNNSYRFLMLLVAMAIVLVSEAQIVTPPRSVQRKLGTKMREGINKGFEAMDEGLNHIPDDEDEPRSGNSQNSISPDSDPNLYPADGSSGVQIPVHFKWEPVTYDGFVATGYEFYICVKGEAEDVYAGGPGGTEFTYSDLKPNTTYTWHVVGSNDTGYMPGPGGTFTTAGASDLGIFKSLSPSAGASNVNLPIQFKWEIDNASQYTYQIYIEGDDWADWISKATTETHFTLSSLPTSSKNLKYRVDAIKNGQTTEGKWISFTTSGKTVATKPAETKAAEPEKPKMNVQWSKFDFVPGDEIIFEDGPDIMEENGEFPSRWDMVSGQVEILNVDGENVIGLLGGNPAIIPYLKNANDDYLPEIFTIEYDMYLPANGGRFQMHLIDQKNQSDRDPQEIEVTFNSISTPNGDYVQNTSLDESYRDKGRWMHISLAFTNGKLKIYMDDTRVINLPRFDGNPSGFTIQAYFADHSDNRAFFLKNVRIAKGGVKYYDRVQTEGKIICNGIKFDVNKATLKPESMGPINKIFELMQKQPDLKFSVEGHTDSDGDEATNQKLSEERAKAVKEQLIAMGISANRLQSKGFGEKKPIKDNSTSEGKANNRRVEFVKIN